MLSQALLHMVEFVLEKFKCDSMTTGNLVKKWNLVTQLIIDICTSYSFFITENCWFLKKSINVRKWCHCFLENCKNIILPKAFQDFAFCYDFIYGLSYIYSWVYAWSEYQITCPQGW